LARQPLEQRPLLGEHRVTEATNAVEDFLHVLNLLFRVGPGADACAGSRRGAEGVPRKSHRTSRELLRGMPGDGRTDRDGARAHRPGTGLLVRDWREGTNNEGEKRARG